MCVICINFILLVSCASIMLLVYDVGHLTDLNNFINLSSSLVFPVLSFTNFIGSVWRSGLDPISNSLEVRTTS